MSLGPHSALGISYKGLIKEKLLALEGCSEWPHYVLYLLG